MGVVATVRGAVVLFSQPARKAAAPVMPRMLTKERRESPFLRVAGWLIGHGLPFRSPKKRAHTRLAILGSYR